MASDAGKDVITQGGNMPESISALLVVIGWGFGFGVIGCVVGYAVKIMFNVATDRIVEVICGLGVLIGIAWGLFRVFQH